MSTSHSAFPAARIANIEAARLPNRAADLQRFITAYQPHPEALVDALYRISEGQNQSGTRNSEKIKHGEEVLAMWRWEVGGVSDDELNGNTATFIFLLSARMEDKTLTDRRALVGLLNLSVRLCMVGDRQQLGSCAIRVSRFASALLNVAEYIRAVPDIIDPLYSLIQRVHPTVFTSAHAVLVDAILSTRQKAQIVDQLVTVPIKDFSWAQPRYIDVLTYFHHLGLIFAVRGDYEQARDAFLSAVVIPTKATSAIQVACAKRAILCEILISGNAIDFPKYTSGTVSRSIERHCDSYIKLAKAYNAKDWGVVRKMQDHKVFRDDQNLGLLQRVVTSIARTGIKDLSQIYTRMTAGDLTAKLYRRVPEAVEEVLLVLESMITTGAIQADITPNADYAQVVITFLDPADSANSGTSFAQLMHIKALSEYLEREITVASKRVGASEAYIRKQVDANKVEGREGKGGKRGEDTDMIDPDALVGSLFPSGKGKMGGKVGGDMNDGGF